ncbi:MAG: hypothetical protein H6Q67_2078 [Firmicutes bacterium]|nr:hypothetical protein [Bacillota bacterium]
MLRQIGTLLFVGAILPLGVSIIIAHSRLGGLLSFLFQIMLPYIMFFRTFPKYGLERGHPPKVVTERIIIASLIWSLAIYLERYSYKVLDPLHRWLALYGIHSTIIGMFIYWSFFLVVAVLLSYVYCEWRIIKNNR